MQARLIAGAMTLLAAGWAIPASGATIADAAGDFLPSFTGAHDADLDVLSFSVSFNSTTSEFLLGAVLGGAINPARAGLYVIGVDTGAGAIAPFAGVGAPNVKFDQVVLVNKDGTGLVTGSTGGPLSAAAITIVGDIFTARVKLSMLPSTGFDPLHYGWNLWPRNGLGNNNQISDFAPNNGLLSVAGVPEPQVWGLMVLGFGLVGVSVRKRAGAKIAAV